MTPSLVALEDASTPRHKEWNRGELGREAHLNMYSTIDGKANTNSACI